MLHLERSDQGILRLDVHGTRLTSDIHADRESIFCHLRLRRALLPVVLGRALRAATPYVCFVLKSQKDGW